MHPTSGGADTVIILARDQASLYDFLKPRQESGGRTIVVLDRRGGGAPPPPNPPPGRGRGRGPRQEWNTRCVAVRQAVGGQPGPVFRFDGDVFTGHARGAARLDRSRSVSRLIRRR